MLLYLGDSLTRGLVGWSYIRFMPRIPHKNRGLDGDTTAGALRRLRLYRSARWYGDVDTCVLAIGTNDVLQPFLMDRSRVWKAVFLWRRGWKRWAGDISVFEARIREILDILREDGIRPVILGLPAMQLKNYPLEELDRRNALLRHLAEEYGGAFADARAAQERCAPGFRTDYDWGRRIFTRGWDILSMAFCHPAKDAASRRRGLELTVDGVHFNSRAAKAVAGELTAALGVEAVKE